MADFRCRHFFKFESGTNFCLGLNLTIFDLNKFNKKISLLFLYV